MKRNFLELASVIGLALLASSLRADTLVGPGGAFQPWTSAVLGPASSPSYTSSTNPGPYWNNASGDGPTANIGWCLTGGGGCVIASPPGPIAYYGTSTGAAVQNMAFVSNGVSVIVTLAAQLTNQVGTPANPGYNVFGWYTIDSKGVIHATTLWTSKNDSVGGYATFNPGPAGTQYGLFLENVQGGGTASEADYFWFMNSSSNKPGGTATSVDSSQHFAIFSGTPGKFVIGMDDTNNGNQDYNNMVVTLANVPEPATLTCLGLGLALIAALRRRQAA